MCVGICLGSGPAGRPSMDTENAMWLTAWEDLMAAYTSCSTQMYKTFYYWCTFLVYQLLLLKLTAVLKIPTTMQQCYYWLVRFCQSMPNIH